MLVLYQLKFVPLMSKNNKNFELILKVRMLEG